MAIHHPSARNIFIGMNVFGTLILFTGLMPLLHQQYRVFTFTALSAAFFFCMPLLSRQAAARMYTAKPDKDTEVRFEISDEGVRIHTQLATSDVRWNLFRKVVRTPNGFLLIPGGKMFHWLPLHAFSNPSDADQFAALAKARVPQYRHAS